MESKKNKTDISVIIPIYNLDEALLQNAILSVVNQIETPDAIILVTSKDSDDLKVLKKLVKEDNGIDIKIVTHESSTSFQNQLNVGVENCKTKWFAYLEQDDEMSKVWIKNVVKYREVYDEISIFLPMILEIDTNNVFLGLANEPVWASEFSEELGVLDKESLLRYKNFNFSGMVMEKKSYTEFGGVKTNMKLSFMYEFLLRMTHNSLKVMVIPKFGYKHMNLRAGSLSETYKANLSVVEGDWWLRKAKTEYFHKKDRELVYEVE